MDIKQTVRDLIEPVIVANNYKLDEVIYEKEGNLYFLRIVIDKDGIIDIDDCVAVSNLINPIIDAEDPIKENYILDVCSKERGHE